MIKDLVFGEVSKDYSAILNNDLDISYSEGNYYLKEEVFRMAWEYDLQPNIDRIHMGKNSGSIAYYRNTNILYKEKPKIKVYNMASILIGTVFVDSVCSACIPFVLDNDDIVAVTDMAEVFVYHEFSLKSKFYVRSVIPNVNVMRATLFKTGIALLSTNGELIIVNNFDSAVLFQKFNELSCPRSFFAIYPSEDVKTGISCLIVTDEGKYIIANQRNFYTMTFDSPVLSASLSPSEDKIAFLLEDMRLIVANSSLSSVLYETSLQTSGLVEFQMMAWLGNYVPAVSFNGGIVLGTTDPDSPCYFFDSIPVLFSECDSVFIITNTCANRLSVIPENVSNIMNKYMKNDSTEFCNIFSNRLNEPFIEKLSKVNIKTCITDCIDASYHIPGIDNQIFFLNAACFGNSFLNHEFSEHISLAIQKIRIINSLKDVSYMSITLPQYDELGISKIIQRLCFRGNHKLAVSISEFVNNPIQPILESHANWVIKNIVDDQEAFSRFQSDIFTDYFIASMRAISQGRENLSRLLANSEKNSNKKSILMGNLGQWDEAIKHAAETCDGNLLMKIVKQALASSSIEQVNSALAKYQSALSILLTVPNLAPQTRMKDIFQLIAPEMKHYFMYSLFTIANSEYTLSLETVASLKRLRSAQEETIEAVGDKKIIGLTLNETLMRLAESGHKIPMKEVAKKCGVETKRLNIIRLHAYGRSKKWTALIKFGAKKKRKEMWQLVVEFLLAKSAMDTALQFIEEVGVVDQKSKILLKQMIESKQLGSDSIQEKRSYYPCFNS